MLFQGKGIYVSLTFCRIGSPFPFDAIDVDAPDRTYSGFAHRFIKLPWKNQASAATPWWLAYLPISAQTLIGAVLLVRPAFLFLTADGCLYFLVSLSYCRWRYWQWNSPSWIWKSVSVEKEPSHETASCMEVLELHVWEFADLSNYSLTLLFGVKFIFCVKYCGCWQPQSFLTAKLPNLP